MNTKKISIGILCLCLLTPLLQHINATATRDQTLDEMITDSFVIIEEDGSSRIVKHETIASKKKEVSVADKYDVVDNIGGEVVETFDSKQEAVAAVAVLEEEENEELTIQPFRLDTINCGVVYINTYDVTNYTMVDTGVTGYTSGAYGRDAAYIGEFNGKVRAKYAGVVADFDPDDVNVHHFDDVNTSYYMEKDGYLYHYYLYGSSAVYASTRVGFDLSYLESNVEYFSYDGHYFYDSYATMIADYQKGTYEHAINVNEPYYNYYQFLSHRSKSNLTGNDFNNMAIDYMGDSSYKTSQFYNIGDAFVKNQNEYTVNAMLMYGVAANESNWGRSSIASDHNNLFGHGANDSNPYWDANKYETVERSVMDHAYYFVSRGYLDYADWRHFGPHLGDKESGLNVKYASDPYWGEKGASRSYYLDSEPADYVKEKVGIIKGTIDSCPLYKEASTSSKVITTLHDLSNIPVLILDEVNANGKLWYKIASDTSLKDDRNSHDFTLVYRPDHDYLYIQAEKVQVVWEPETPISSKEKANAVEIKEEKVVTGYNATLEDLLKDNPTAVVKKIEVNGETSEEVTITDPKTALGTGFTVTIGEKTYTIVKVGDVNGDGKLSPSDYVKVKNHIMQTATIAETFIEGADINEDGKISPADYAKIKNIIMNN